MQSLQNTYIDTSSDYGTVRKNYPLVEAAEASEQNADSSAKEAAHVSSDACACRDEDPYRTHL